MYPLDNGGHFIEYAAQWNSCNTLSKAAPPYNLRLKLEGSSAMVMPGHLTIPLCFCSSSVV